MEAVAITEDGASFAILADKVIVEINLAQPAGLEGLHDIWIPRKRPLREPPEKIVAIVLSDQPESTSSVLPPDAQTAAIASHLIRFFEQEIEVGRLTQELLPLQAGIGTVIEQCTAEPYKSMLRAYVREARQRGGQTPHVLEQAYAWHTRYGKTGSMLEA